MATAPESDLPPSSMKADQQRKRSRVPLWLLGLILLVPCLCCGGSITLGVSLFSGVIGLIRSSEPYTHAVATAKADQRVVNALGEPIQEGWLPSGKINYGSNQSTANLTIPLSGSHGSGRIVVLAKKLNGPWQYSTLKVQILKTGRWIDLNQPPGAQAK